MLVAVAEVFTAVRLVAAVLVALVVVVQGQTVAILLALQALSILVAGLVVAE
jgi:hypothetical protein